MQYYGTEVVPDIIPLNEKYPNVCLEISSFMDTCIGAKHFYGSLKCGLWVFNLVREVTKAEVNDGTGRWEDYEPGDMTQSFNSIYDIYELAKKCFKARFAYGHKLYVTDLTYDKNHYEQIM